ncbi:FabD/lysophospholipase-like protein [Sistotremastrum niveocremeum HHB9708]|uniref:FabD/lysophospholipase-like protein n=1 Tax=Sistotremastrum niveocremeum HHB9708 TaxID=1314777 RepID=A0A164W5K4_9AGAM|nr:FabD/lysophospholipase-like protein [Sistotremastrum niveocremeum HHB9708]
MHRIQAEEGLLNTPLPCEYFDLIGGTSTGGLIALLLGRLAMSVQEAITVYGKFAEDVFSDVKHFGEGKFRAHTLEKIVKDVVKKKTGDSDEKMIGDVKMGTRTLIKTVRFVCTMAALNMNAAIPRLFRTYKARKNPSYNCTIWEAARATSAAPTFFKHIVIGEPGTQEPYIDGGMGRNNPTAQLLQEAAIEFPGQEIGCIVSIGTGKGETIRIPKPSLFQRVLPLDIVTAMRGMATDSERTAEEVARRFEGMPEKYFRFNVEQGMQDVGLSHWERLDEVTAHTRQYLQLAEPDSKLSSAIAVMRQRPRLPHQVEDFR